MHVRPHPAITIETELRPVNEGTSATRRGQ